MTPISDPSRTTASIPFEAQLAELFINRIKDIEAALKTAFLAAGAYKNMLKKKKENEVLDPDAPTHQKVIGSSLFDALYGISTSVEAIKEFLPVVSVSLKEEGTECRT